MGNLLELPPISHDENEEIFEALLPDKGVLIERIISIGQASPENFWYDQERDEWVVVLQGSAKLTWIDGRHLELKPGDWVFIPAHDKHRVEWTSSNPPCIWLAVHGALIED
ncbi:MAG: cupin domain-containing protein [Syntrophomonadaceae bacterium]|nr:cupin domain-containing protein [Syntrophomonadaceae bacterium]